VLESDSGEQLAILANKTTGGEIDEVTGGACFAPGGGALTFWFGDNGLPLYAVAGDYLFHFYNYTTGTVDIIVTDSVGTSTAINGVSIPSGQVAECQQFASLNPTGGDVWRWVSAGMGIVVCGIIEFAQSESITALDPIVEMGCGGSGLGIIDEVLEATGGYGFGSGVMGTSLSGASCPDSCVDLDSDCQLWGSGWSTSQINSFLAQAIADRDLIIGGPGEGGLRFVLTWNEYPSDLDSHLWTPIIDSESHHIYYSSRNYYSVTESPYADLDVDDLTSFGPETVTIARLFPGTYLYSVYNYTGSPDITTSGAKVTVFDATGFLGQYSIPTTGAGRRWHVFQIDGATGNLTLVNTINDISNKNFNPALETK
jgi:hypothetical protein